MLFFLVPVVIGLITFFINISTWNRGKFRTSIGFGIGFGILGFIPGLIVCAICTDWGYNDIRYSHPVDDGIVSVSVPEDGDPIYAFRSNGKPKVIEAYEGDVVLMPLSDENKYRKVCGKTPSWVAPFNMASCRTEIYVK